jgi:hypothetical protein
MKLTADTINGVMMIEDFDQIGNLEFYEIVDSETFYDSLSTMKNDDLILATNVTLSLAKKIHQEYGITRF